MRLDHSCQVAGVLIRHVANSNLFMTSVVMRINIQRLGCDVPSLGEGLTREHARLGRIEKSRSLLLDEMEVTVKHGSRQRALYTCNTGHLSFLRVTVA